MILICKWFKVRLLMILLYFLFFLIIGFDSFGKEFLNLGMDFIESKRNKIIMLLL